MVGATSSRSLLPRVASCLLGLTRGGASPRRQEKEKEKERERERKKSFKEKEKGRKIESNNERAE